MNYAIVGGVIVAILLLVKYMVGRAKADAVISSLQGVGNQKEKEEFITDAARLEQEILDAKLDYTRIRDQHKSSLRQGDLPSGD